MKHKRTKNFIKMGILLFGISIALNNCQVDDAVTFEQVNQNNIKTVSFEEAKAFFENATKNQYAQRNSSDALVLNPDWNTLQQNDLAYNDVQLTKVETEVNRIGDYQSKLIFLNINEIIRSVIITTWVTEYDTQNNILDANVYINEYDGTFIDAFKIENGIFIKRLVPSPNIQTGSFFMFLQDQLEEDECWNTDLLTEGGGELGEVDLGSIPSNGGGSDNPLDGTGAQGPAGPNGNTDYGGYLNGAANDFGAGGELGTGLPSSKVDKALAAAVINPPSDNNTFEEEEEEERNRRCNQLADIKDNGNYTARMQELRTATTGQKEILYYGIRDDNGNMNYANEDRVEGGDDYIGVHGIPDHIISNPVDSAMHNHFSGALPIFSPGDLYSLYHLFSNNLIVDTSTFIMYVITPGNNLSSTADDTLYALTISDVTQFQVNGDLFLQNEKGIASIFNHAGINPNISTSLNEERFLKVINSSNLGLTLYRGNPDDLTEWSQLKLRNDDTIKERNCN